MNYQILTLNGNDITITVDDKLDYLAYVKY